MMKTISAQIIIMNICRTPHNEMILKGVEPLFTMATSRLKIRAPSTEGEFRDFISVST